MRIFWMAVGALSLCGTWTSGQDKTWAGMEGPYFGQEVPGRQASLFGSGFISTGMYERDFAITPEGDQIFFTIMGGTFSVICCTKRVGMRWTRPEVAPFSGRSDAFDAEPHVAPDGKTLLFLSTRPPEGQDPTPGWRGHQNIWVCDRTDSGWSEPRLFGDPVSTDEPEYFPSVTRSGNLYFTKGKNGVQEAGLWRCRLEGSAYRSPEPLPKQINAGKAQYNGSIAPDESYLVFCANDPEVNPTQPGYFVSFRSPADRWSVPLKLGPEINLPGGQAISIMVTPDGKFIFFSSNAVDPKYSQQIQSYDLLHAAQNSPRNGRSDIYWIQAEVVTDLRNQATWPD